MGGTDVNPRTYGEEAVPETDAPDDERDAVEFEVLQAALEKDVAVLAICRGLQLLNIFHGGTLVQHLSSERHDPEFADSDKVSAAHEVSINPDSLLAKIVGRNTLEVNSRHHQAVKELGRGLHITARDTEDGTVEGLERRDKRFVVAVQWHPEDQCVRYPEQLKLFQGFADAL
jgi:gamma-glutamyl-gamma-aminobutyrate hydrolase PuuD